MNSITSIALLVCGVILIIYGVNASDSLGTSFSNMCSGARTDKTIWFVVGGIVALIIGLYGLLT